MGNEYPLIHLFSTYRKKYFFDANRNQVINVSDDVYAYLSKCMESSDFFTSASEIKDTFFVRFYERALSKGFFSSNRVKKIRHIATDNIPYIVSKGLNGVALQVTQMCNLRCEYCPYSGHLYVNRAHSGKRMSWETAQRSIDFYINNSQDSKYIGLAFYGGEPLLEFELIKKCVLYIKSRVNNKEIRFDITSNGTLLSDEIIKFFIEHDFQLMISLDGPEEVHNRYRKFVNQKGSFHTVIENVKHFNAMYPDYFKRKVMFNAVISPDREVSCISDFFDHESALSTATINASPVSDNSLKDDVAIHVSDEYSMSIKFENFKVILNRLGLYNAINPQRPSIFTGNYENIRELSKNLIPINGLPESFHPGGPCIPGIKKFFINVDGEFFPCERVNENSQEMNIGNLDKGINYDQIVNLINIGQLTEKQCKDCWAFIHCSQCCSHCEHDGKLKPELRLRRCGLIRRNLDADLKAYCMFKEFGYDFGLEKSGYFCDETR